MKKFIIKWDIGYGPSYDTVEADSIDEANEIAYESWREEAENQANYSAEEWSESLAEDCCLD